MASGRRSLRVTAETYSHALADEKELDYANLLGRTGMRSHGAYPGACLSARKSPFAGCSPARRISVDEAD